MQVYEIWFLAMHVAGHYNDYVLVQTEISLYISIAMTFCTDICGSQRMHQMSLVILDLCSSIMLKPFVLLSEQGQFYNFSSIIRSNLSIKLIKHLSAVLWI